MLLYVVRTAKHKMLIIKQTQRFILFFCLSYFMSWFKVSFLKLWLKEFLQKQIFRCCVRVLLFCYLMFYYYYYYLFIRFIFILSFHIASNNILYFVSFSRNRVFRLNLKNISLSGCEVSQKRTFCVVIDRSKCILLWAHNRFDNNSIFLSWFSVWIDFSQQKVSFNVTTTMIQSILMLSLLLLLLHSEQQRIIKKFAFFFSSTSLLLIWDNYLQNRQAFQFVSFDVKRTWMKLLYQKTIWLNICSGSVRDYLFHSKLLEWHICFRFTDNNVSTL